jgi:hypothetical protein
MRWVAALCLLLACSAPATALDVVTTVIVCWLVWRGHDPRA